MRLPSRWLLVVVLALAVCCKAHQPEKAAEPQPLSRELHALAAKLPGGAQRFPLHVARSRQHGRQFLRLARVLDRPALAAAAFHALAAATEQAPLRRLLLGEEYAKTVAAGLTHEDRGVVAGALAASAAALAEPTLRDSLLRAVLSAGERFPDEGARLSVLEALLQPWATDIAGVRALAVDSLGSPSAAVVVLSLEYLAQLGWDSASKGSSKGGPELGATLFRLLKDARPAVRGRALDLVAALPPALGPSPSPTRLIEDTLLHDDDGFVRARACWAVARMTPDAAPRLLKSLLKDTARASTEVQGATMSGELRRRALDGSPLAEVRDAAIGGLQIVSRGAFKVSSPRSKKTLDTDAASALVWVNAEPQASAG